MFPILFSLLDFGTPLSKLSKDEKEKNDNEEKATDTFTINVNGEDLDLGYAENVEKANQHIKDLLTTNTLFDWLYTKEQKQRVCDDLCARIDQYYADNCKDEPEPEKEQQLDENSLFTEKDLASLDDFTTDWLENKYNKKYNELDDDDKAIYRNSKDLFMEFVKDLAHKNL